MTHRAEIGKARPEACEGYPDRLGSLDPDRPWVTTLVEQEGPHVRVLAWRYYETWVEALGWALFKLSLDVPRG